MNVSKTWLSAMNELTAITPMDPISVSVTKVFTEMDFTVQVGFVF